MTSNIVLFPSLFRTLAVRSLAILTAFLAALVFLTGYSVAQGFSPAVDLSAQDTHLAVQSDILILVDIRTPEEWAQTGVAEGAHPISMLDQNFLAELAQLQDDNPGKPVAFICASGRRSALVQTELARRGYKDMFSVYGGTTGSRNAPGWIRDGLPITAWAPN